MVRAEAPNDGPGLTDASVGFKCWPDSDAPSLRLSFLLFKIFYIFHLSVCLHDSPSEYLTLEGGTKPRRSPVMPPGCHCSLRLTLFVSLCVYCSLLELSSKE